MQEQGDSIDYRFQELQMPQNLVGHRVFLIQYSSQDDFEHRLKLKADPSSIEALEIIVQKLTILLRQKYTKVEQMGKLINSMLTKIEFLRVIILRDENNGIQEVFKWCNILETLKLMEVYTQKPYHPPKTENPKIKLIWLHNVHPEVILKNQSEPIPEDMKEWMERDWNKTYICQKQCSEYFKIKSFTGRLLVGQLQFSWGQTYYPILESIRDIQFPFLKAINLQNFYLKSLEHFSLMRAPSLEQIQFSINSISCLRPLVKINSKMISRLSLCSNKITELGFLAQIDWPLFYWFDLSNTLYENIFIQSVAVLAKYHYQSKAKLSFRWKDCRKILTKSIQDKLSDYIR